MRRVRRRCADEEEKEEDEDSTIHVHEDTIYYRGDIEEKYVSPFCIALRKLSETHSLIHIVLTTTGGCVFSGLNMYEALRHCKVDTCVTADGCVCSAGTFLLLGGKERRMYGTAVVMIHALSTWMGEGHVKPKDLREELLNTEVLLNIMTSLYKKHTRLKLPKLRQMYSTDTYIDARQCLDLGIVDRLS